MPGDVDPFQPWRPKDSWPSGSEPLKPWRPANEPPRDEPASEPAWSAVPREPSPSGGASLPQVAFIVLAAMLGMGLLVGVAVNGVAHITRLGAAALAVAAGGFVLLFVRRLPWYARAGGAALGVGLAVVSWYFVPTSAGLSLRGAERAMAELRDLPAGDFTAFEASQHPAGQLKEGFPRWRADVERAEAGWVRRTIAKETADADGAADPRAAWERLRVVGSKLERLPAYSLESGTLTEARERSLRAILSREGKDVLALAKREAYVQARERVRQVELEFERDARELGSRQELADWARDQNRAVLRRQATSAVAALERLHDAKKYAEVATQGRQSRIKLVMEGDDPITLEVELPKLDAVRTKALRARLALAEGELKSLADKGQHADVPAKAQSAHEAMKSEAQALALSATVQSALLAHRKAALLARVKAARSALQALHDKKDYAAVPKRHAELLRELTAEAEAVDEPLKLKAELGEVREKALLARVDLAKKELEGLFDKKEHAKVATRGAALQSDLGPEAEAVAASGRVRKALDEVRGKALQARLDDATKKLEGLIAKKSLAAVATRGGEFDAALRPEAKAIDRVTKLDDAVLAPRRTALLARVDLAKKELEGLLARKDNAGVASKGASHRKDLAAEARVVGETDKLDEELLPARRKALRARLEAAKAQSRELLKKDRYEAIGELGEKTHKDLAGEAEVVGAAGDVKKFRDGCRVFADLAKKAKVKEKK